MLGVTNECIQIDSRQHNLDAILKLVSAAQYQIAIISRHLDSQIFNNEEVMHSALMLARRAKFSNIRILVHDPIPMIKNGHRLLELSQRISSKVEIRKICQSHSHFNQSFLVADNIAYIHNIKSDLYDAEVNFSDKEKSKDLMETFKNIWGQSSQDTTLRRLCV